MSEGGGSAGPDVGPNYQNSGPANYSNPPSQPPTPSSTVQDPPNYQNAEISENSNESKTTLTNLHSNSASGLPPFSSFSASDVTEGLGGRLAGDGYLTSDGISSTRVMELSGWDYCYTDGLSGRYVDRGDSMPVMIPQPQYRPWESKQDGSSDSIKSTLPSFQSQFGEELVTTLTTLTPAACSPAPSVPSPGLPSFHTLSAVNPRYPLVPAPVQAREIPSIQQQFLDERHIHLFQGPPGQNFTLQPQNGLNGQTLTSLNNGTTLTTLNNAQYHPQIINNAQILSSGQILAPQSHILAPSSQIITSNGHIITSSGGQGLTVVSQNSTPTVLTVVKAEPVNIVELKPASSENTNLTQLHHTNFQNPMITQGQQMDSKFGLESPPRGVDGRKKERRKIRASSLESSNESDGAMSVESSGQVAAVSSTAGFKSPMTPGQMNNEGEGMIADTGEKQTKKKRKRCGECIGCQRKDNCGDCAPCRNDKSHQICKMRRCEKLTEKKHLLAYNREDGGVSYRGRGRGRGRGSRGGYRGKGARPGTQSAQVNSVVNEMNPAGGMIVTSNRENVKVDGGRVSSGPVAGNPALPPTMAVPFYPGTEVWSTGASADPWANQGQFIHQIDDIRYQHYPGYQTTGYQQSGFISDQTSAFQPQYTNATNGNPSTSPAQGNVTPRSTGSYPQVHTPTPSPNPSTPHVNGHRNGINVHYVDENYVNGNTFTTDSSMVPPASTTPNSRSSSVHLEANDTNSKTSGYMSGNEIPGYPLNSPQCQSSCNSSGYPGQSIQSEFGDQSINGSSYQSNGGKHLTQRSPSCTQVSPGTYHNYQNYNTTDDHQNVVKSSLSPSNCHPSQKSSGTYSQNSPKSYNSNPSPQNYQDVSPGQNRNAAHYDGRTLSNGNLYQSERYDHQNYRPQSPNSQNQNQTSPTNSNQDKNTVNARIKSMIMNKHHLSQSQQPQQLQNIPNNSCAGNENHLMSPNREIMSPGHKHNAQLMSPIMQNSQQIMSPLQTNNHLMSPKHQTSSPISKDSESYVDKVHQNDFGEKKEVQANENPNHFLAFSHHLRDGSRLHPGGGGFQNWPGTKLSGSNFQYLYKSDSQGIIGFNSELKKQKATLTKQKNLLGSPDNNKLFCGYKEIDSDIDILRRLSLPVNVWKNSETKAFYKISAPDSVLQLNFHTKTKPPTGCNGEKNERNLYYFQAGTTSDDVCENGIIKNCCQDNGLGRIQNNFESYKIWAEKSRRSNNYVTRKEQINSDYQQKTYGRKEPKEWLPQIREADFQYSSPACLNIKFAENKMKHYSQLANADVDAMVRAETNAVLEYTRDDKSREKNGQKNYESFYPVISYAPNCKNVEIIDKRCEAKVPIEKTNWENYRKAMGSGSRKNNDLKKESYLFQGEGGPCFFKTSGAWCCRLGGIEPPTLEHIKDGYCQGYQTADEFSSEKEEAEKGDGKTECDNKRSSVSTPEKENLNQSGNSESLSFSFENSQDRVETLRNNLRADVPDCQCFPPDKCPPEPGTYYTHLGAAASLRDLRKDVESRTGQTGKALRIEKICYTGKEGKTTQGCPLAKWVIRRSGLEEKVLIVVKHRQGHTCSTAWVVVCLVAWEGVPSSEADYVYTLLSHKLNKFGLPTSRRCATNELRTCACQGLNPDTCGASFSFGCSWSMYYNGCKYARSKSVRKFRLSVRSEEQEVEERLHFLATLLSPLYNTLAPDSFRNQTLFEREAVECRLGFKPGRPFSGVTACIDFCAHSHRDLHNMNNGCTVVVTLTKHRAFSKPEDEQLHVLPLYSIDDTDEYGCKESQIEKYKNGSIECLNKFPCEVRVRAVPLQPCRRHGKKRKDEDFEAKVKNPNFNEWKFLELSNNAGSMQPGPSRMDNFLGLGLQLQSSQVSSTVTDSPQSMHHGWDCNYRYQKEVRIKHESGSRSQSEAEFERKQSWTNSEQVSPWNLIGLKADTEGGPDSTTCQVRSWEAKRANESNSIQYPDLTLASANNQSTLLWRQFHTRETICLSSKEFCLGRASMSKPSEWLNQTSATAVNWNRMPQSDPGIIENMQCETKPSLANCYKVNLNSPNNSQEKVYCNNGNLGVTNKELWFERSKPVNDSIRKQNLLVSSGSEFNSAKNFHGNSFINNQSFNIGNCSSFSAKNKQFSPRMNLPESLGYLWESRGLNNFSEDSIASLAYSSNEVVPARTEEDSKSALLGQVTEYTENEECFKDSQMGGVAIALGHGSVLFECAKHELHATTALKKPNRLRPTRISLVFYQHRNLNRARHGWDEWEEKMKSRKLGVNAKKCEKYSKGCCAEMNPDRLEFLGFGGASNVEEKVFLRIPTCTTTTWTNVLPMRPCMVTGPFKEGGD